MPIFLLTGCGTKTMLNYLGTDENIVDLSGGDYMLCAVTDRGNCYVSGQSVTEESNYGLKDYDTFNKEFDILNPDKFVEIYDGGDAVSVNMNSMGGCIFTKKHDMYLFLNNNDSNDYKTPKYFCSNCVDAKITRFNVIYLLQANGDFGYAEIDSPEVFHLICQDVRKFRYKVYENSFIFYILTNDNRLYAFDPNEKTKSPTECRDNVLDFDFLSPSTERDVLSVLDTDHNAYHCTYTDMWEFNADKLLKGLHKIGSDITSVQSYDLGTVMRDNNGKMRLFGSDMDTRHTVFFGEEVFQNENIKERLD